MALYDEKIVYGKDLVPYGQKLVDKIKGNIVDNLNSNETNKFLSANQGKILNETKLDKTEKAENSKLSDVSVRLQTSRNIILTGGVSGRASFDGTADATITTTLSDIDASKITSGTIDIARLPKGALERVIVVANDESRFALTKSEVQNGDTVKVTQTLKMYFVKDDNQLSTESGYEEYTAGKATAVDWTGIQGKPESFPPSAHNQASNTINAMTGYAKIGSGAISSSDSLNVAIGKLEVALDTKEPTISKQSGFNLPKSDATNEANSGQLATSLAVKTAYDKGMDALNKVTVVEQSVGSKLDKGGYNGTAKDLKGLVDGKVSKSGDTFTGVISFPNNTFSRFGSNGQYIIGADVIYKQKGGHYYRILDEEIFNDCPYFVGDIYITTNTENPATKWTGTTWTKIEGRFLLGTASGGASKQTGGSNIKKISVDNLPSHTHSADTAPHTHGRGTMNIVGSVGNATYGMDIIGNGAIYAVDGKRSYSGGGGGTSQAFNFDASRSWTGSTSEASPATSIGSTGGGQALDITPSYYTVHMWLRES